MSPVRSRPWPPNLYYCVREILLADDERVIRESIKAMLLGEGFLVRLAKDGEDAVAKFSEKRPALVILDVMMPRMNGFRACEEIRKIDQTIPIIFLTAKDSEADQVRGLDVGADDYIFKDVGESIMLARIRRALGRGAVVGEAGILRLGKVSVNLRTFEIANGEHGAELTKSELVILKVLSENQGSYISKDALFSVVYSKDFIGDVNTIRTHICNLKRKLGVAGNMIVNKIGCGYALMQQ